MNCIYTQQDLERVMERYSVMVYRLAYVLVKSKSEAEDVCQDVFLTLMNENPTFPLVKDERDYMIKETIASAKRHKAAGHYQPGKVKVFGQEVIEGKDGYLLDSMLHGVRKKSILMMHLSVVERVSKNDIAELLSCRKKKVRWTIRQTEERMQKNEDERLERIKRVHKRMLEDRREELMKVTYHEVHPTLFRDYKIEGEDTSAEEKESAGTKIIQTSKADLNMVAKEEKNVSEIVKSEQEQNVGANDKQFEETEESGDEQEKLQSEEHAESEPYLDGKEGQFDEAQTIKISIEKIKREREQQKEKERQEQEQEKQQAQSAELVRKEQKEAKESVATTDAAILEELSAIERYQKYYENIGPSVFLKNEIMCHLLEILYERICKREEERIKQEQIHDKERGIYKKQKSPDGQYQNISIVKSERLLRGKKAVLLAFIVCVVISAPILVFAVSYDQVLSYIGTKVTSYFKPIGSSDEQSGVRMKVLNAIQDGESAVFYIEVKDEEGQFDGEIALKDYTIHSMNAFCLAGITKINNDTSIVRFVAKDWDGSISSQVRLEVQSILSGITRYDDFLLQQDILNTCKEASSKEKLELNHRAIIEENGEGYEVVLGEQNWGVLLPLGWQARREKEEALELEGKEADETVLKEIERKQEISISQTISEAYLSGVGLIDGKLHIQADWGDTYHTGSFYLIDSAGKQILPYISFRFDVDDQGKMKAGSTYEEYIFLTEGEDLSQYQLVASDFIENDRCTAGDWKMNFKVGEASGSIDLTTKGKIYGAQLHKFTITPAKIVIRGTYGSNVSRIRIDIVSRVDSQTNDSKESFLKKVLSSNLLSKLNIKISNTDTNSSAAATTTASATPIVSMNPTSVPTESSNTLDSSEPISEAEVLTQTSTYLYVMNEDDDQTFTLSWTPTLPIALDDILQVYLNGSLVYEKKK